MSEGTLANRNANIGAKMESEKAKDIRSSNIIAAKGNLQRNNRVFISCI
jgi:hypothetical protein